VSPNQLHDRLARLIGYKTVAATEPQFGSEQRRDGYLERAVSFRSVDGMVPALLLEPEAPNGAAAVVHHQHNSQWQLGKSEVAGLLGDRWQAFGPALARSGVTVLACDAVGFEDRRSAGPGGDERASDRDNYWALASYRLLQGRPLMRTVLADATAGHSLLAEMPGVDPARIGGLGHSMGGATAIFHAALGQRVAFVASSCAACTFAQRMADGTDIEAAQVLPRLLELADLDDVTALIAPRPLLPTSATDDKYSRDATRTAQAAGRRYRYLDAEEAISHERFAGGHALTRERFEMIVEWVVARARCGW
jgi:dienelactone hydrolase